jgi:C1A family cysteine protease
MTPTRDGFHRRIRMVRSRPSSRVRRGAPQPRSTRWYGWTPDLPDQRDRLYRAPLARLGPLPARVDLRPGCPPVHDQGPLGSCTANAIAGAIAFDQLKQDLADPFVPSRLFIYYNERVIEGTVDEDAGAMIRDGIKSVARQGAPHETLWPYAIARFRTRPVATAYADARKHPAVLYQRITRDLEQFRGCLASGFPFVFGFSVFDSFERAVVAQSGVVPMPKPAERLLGGHAVLAVGYDHATRRILARNSWGPGWGMAGYFTMPYDYLLAPNLSDDFWSITLVQ